MNSGSGVLCNTVVKEGHLQDFIFKALKANVNTLTQKTNCRNMFITWKMFLYFHHISVKGSFVDLIVKNSGGGGGHVS